MGCPELYVATVALHSTVLSTYVYIWDACDAALLAPSFLPSLTDGWLVPGDASGVKAMHVGGADKEQGQDKRVGQQGIGEGRDNVGVPVGGVPSTAYDWMKPRGTS